MAVRRETPSAPADKTKSSDWTTVLFVCIAIIPVIFVCSALWWKIGKTRRERHEKQLDIEMNNVGKKWWNTNYLQVTSQDNLALQARRDQVYKNLRKGPRPLVLPGLLGNNTSQASLPRVPPPVALPALTKRETLGPDPRQFYEGYGQTYDTSSIYSQDGPSRPAPVRRNSMSEIDRILNLQLELAPAPRKLGLEDFSSADIDRAREAIRNERLESFRFGNDQLNDPDGVRKATLFDAILKFDTQAPPQKRSASEKGTPKSRHHRHEGDSSKHHRSRHHRHHRRRDSDPISTARTHRRRNSDAGNLSPPLSPSVVGHTRHRHGSSEGRRDHRDGSHHHRSGRHRKRSRSLPPAPQRKARGPMDGFLLSIEIDKKAGRKK